MVIFSIGVAGGISFALLSSLRSSCFCDSESAACAGCNLVAFRYAVAKAEKWFWECDMESIRLKLGKRSALVVFGVFDAGKLEAVTVTLLNGYATMEVSTTCISRLLSPRYRLTNRIPTSNPSPPFPITLFSPLTKSPASPTSSSILLLQSFLPVQIKTCSE